MFLVRPYIGLVKEVGIQCWADVSFLWMVTFDEGWWERDEIGEEVTHLQVGKKKERNERSINERLGNLADSESSSFKHDRLIKTQLYDKDQIQRAFVLFVKPGTILLNCFQLYLNSSHRERIALSLPWKSTRLKANAARSRGGRIHVWEIILSMAIEIK